MTQRNGRYAIFVDGANVYATSKALRVNVDYRKLLSFFGDGLVSARYYTAILDKGIDPETGLDRDNLLIPLLDWLSYNGYNLVSKPAKEWLDAAGRSKIKGNMDIEIAVDALELAPHIDHAILFSGDGDFKALVDALHRVGVRVTVVSSMVSSPPMVADELRRACDTFWELRELVQQMESPPLVPAAKPVSRYG